MLPTSAKSATSATRNMTSQQQRRRTRTQRSDSTITEELRPEVRLSTPQHPDQTTQSTRPDYNYDLDESNRTSTRHSIQSTQTPTPKPVAAETVSDILTELDNLQKTVLSLGSGNSAKLNKKDMFDLILQISTISNSAVQLKMEIRELEGTTKEQRRLLNTALANLQGGTTTQPADRDTPNTYALQQKFLSDQNTFGWRSTLKQGVKTLITFRYDVVLDSSRQNFGLAVKNEVHHQVIHSLVPIPLWAGITFISILEKRSFDINQSE
ncbi:hypothetical protein FQA39_LY00149 [Lamprigera yunnana]|nr:hypothetical protein FQA39_LY00149 [Lamprigera yunnana]